MGRVNKVAYIIPGYPYKVRQKPYWQIAGFFKSRGIKPVLVNMRWKHTTLSDNLEQFVVQYRRFGGKDVYIIGFSIGAVAAFIASTRVKAKAVILCSLSPVFREDLAYLKKSWRKYLGRRRLEDYKCYSFNQLVGQLNCRTFLIAGSKEEPLLLRRVRAAARKLTNSTLVIVKGAKHAISQKEYLETIERLVSKI